MPEKDVFALTSGALSLRVSPRSGKVESIDCMTGAGLSPLLVEKPLDAEEKELATTQDCFSIREAWGFDECFPSVAGAASLGVRDHGELWERGAISWREGKALHTRWEFGNCSFLRSIEPLEPAGDLLGGFSFFVRFPRYVVLQNRGELRSIYAAHALFTIDSGDVLRILESGSLGETELFSATVPAAQYHEAQKLYFSFGVGAVARLFRQNLGVEVVVSGASFPLGVWWCNNGWGDGREHRTVGIEPTNCPTDGPIFAKSGADAQADEEMRFRIAVWAR